MITYEVNFDGDLYIENRIKAALVKQLPESCECQSTSGNPDLQWTSYERLNYDFNDEHKLRSSYIIRKALIRKANLVGTVNAYVAKNPSSRLATSIPQSFVLEIDFAEYLDEALDDQYELRDALLQSNPLSPVWYILKPSMADGGHDIFPFSNSNELRKIFEAYDAYSESNTDEEQQTSVVNQMQFYVAQLYIPPLVVNSRKFHLRVYVLAVGALKVFVWPDVLALLAQKEYLPPSSSNFDPKIHLSNTGLSHGSSGNLVMLLADLPLTQLLKTRIYDAICEITREVFLAAATTQTTSFQPLPNTFELFGLDFIVSNDEKIYLLEVNAYPDFKQTGDELGNVISELFEATIITAIRPFFKLSTNESSRFTNVLDHQLHNWWSSR